MKKKGRALTAVLLGLTMVMSLAGCGQKKESTADTAAAGSEAAKTEESAGEKSTSAEMETITLKLGFNGDFLTMPEAVLGAAENLNKKYEQEGKNIRIEFETDYQTIDNSEYHNNIVFAHKSGDAPDIFICDADVAGFVKAGCVLDITDVMSDAFVDGVFTPTMAVSYTHLDVYKRQG